MLPVQGWREEERRRLRSLATSPNRQTRLCKKLEDFETGKHASAKNWRILNPADNQLRKKWRILKPAATSLKKTGGFKNRKTSLTEKKLEDLKTSRHLTEKNWRILKPADNQLKKLEDFKTSRHLTEKNWRILKPPDTSLTKTGGF